MKLFLFLEEKIGFILFQTVFIFIIFLLLILLGGQMFLSFLLASFLIIYTFGYLGIEYLIERKKYIKMINLVDSFEEKYFLSEMLSKPKNLKSQAYYYALKESCKAMNDKIGELEKDKEDFEEYVESFVHDIKTPLTFLSLAFDNQGSEELKEELQVIEKKVEQMLFYARSSNPEKDYFVKKSLLEDLIHPVIMDYKSYLLKNKIKLVTHDLDLAVFTDWKWMHFILSQIFQNSVKYLDKKNKIMEIWSKEDTKNNIILYIKDNGCGIKSSDLGRVFEKGFTGENRFKNTSTGMGLYLAKKLCNKLGLLFTIESCYKEFTLVSIVFPKNDFYKIHD